MTLEELRAALEAAQTEARSVDAEAGDHALTADQQTRFDAALAQVDQLTVQIAAEESRNARRTDLARSIRPGTESRGVRAENGDGASAAPAVHIRSDPFAVLDDRSITGRERRSKLRDGLLRSNENLIDGGENQSHFESVLKRHGSDTQWAENLLARSREDYATGFSKMMTGRSAFLSDAERRAMDSGAEERAAVSVGTNAHGGFLVPTHLDPTLILTNAGSANVLRASSATRKVTLTEGSVWNGATSSGITGSWDGELVEVSDDSPNDVARQSITTFTGKAFVQASIQAFEDIAGLQSDVLMLFADARDVMEGAAHATGTGSGQPLGLFTAINASASLRVVSTTAATIGEVDVHALYRALPQRFRGRGTWVMNPLYALAIKRLGTAVSSAYSGDLTAPVTDRILGRPVLETDDAPSTQTTTTLDQELVYADLSQFVIVDKPGSTSIEFIPNLFATANNLPDGRRGWVMYLRTGSGMPALNGGRVLVDRTSA
jgi:HK97 family phage major capsid protein